MQVIQGVIDDKAISAEEADRLSAAMIEYYPELLDLVPIEEPADSIPDKSVETRVTPLLVVEPETRFGLTEEQRMGLWRERIFAGRRARRDAGIRYPIGVVDTIQIGAVIRLQGRVSLMPELDPADPTAAMRKMRVMTPGTDITVVGVAVDNSQLLWYEVRTVGASGSEMTGWVIAPALVTQLPKDNWSKNLDLDEQLREQYIQELLREHSLSIGQLDTISIEAARKNWPIPL